MTQQEFTSRTMVEVSSKEFDAINEMYLACDLHKDDFCKMWCKMNASRVKAAKQAMKEAAALQKLNAILYKIVEKYDRVKFEFKSAFDVLSEKECDACVRCGIALEGMTMYGMRDEQVFSVLYNIKKYLHIC